MQNSSPHMSPVSGHRSAARKPGAQSFLAPDRARHVTHLCSFEALADVQVGGGLVDHVYIGLLCGHHCDSKPLQFPT